MKRLSIVLCLKCSLSFSRQCLFSSVVKDFVPNHKESGAITPRRLFVNLRCDYVVEGNVVTMHRCWNEDSDEISRQIAGKDKDSYFQRSCLNAVFILVHVWSGKFKGKCNKIVWWLCVKVVDGRVNSKETGTLCNIRYEITVCTEWSSPSWIILALTLMWNPLVHLLWCCRISVYHLLSCSICIKSILYVD